jgi:hypothetical protein
VHHEPPVEVLGGGAVLEVDCAAAVPVEDVELEPDGA